MEACDIMRKAPFRVDSFSHVKIAPPGLILEFGVAEGKTIRLLAAETEQMVYGFDSFYGLPENWGAALPKGAFDCHGQIPEDLPKNVECIVGLFQDTLPLFLEEHSGPLSFVHIDCDLYSSTSFVLQQLKGRLQEGTILAFDELIDWNTYIAYVDAGYWRNSEYKAFLELIEETNLSWKCLSRNCEQQVAIQITKV
jgi:hypothetical protein